jgi:Photosynthesis system II assembly factor YCF48/Putative zinc-finger
VNQIPESARRRMQAQAAGDHPDADLLAAFAEHTLAGNERERVLSHLAACTTCREVVSLAMPEQSDAEVVAPAAHAWFRWPMLRWTAVAATVIVVWAAVSVLAPRKQNQEVSAPVVESVPAASAVAADQPNTQALPSVAESRNAQMADKVTAAEQLKPLEAESAKAKAMEVEGAKEENARKDALKLDAASSKVAVSGGMAGGKVQENVAVTAQAAPAAPPPATQSEAVNVQRQAAPLGGLRAGAPMVLSKAGRVEEGAVRWRVSSTGAVERSGDGKSWVRIEIDPGVTFRALSSNGGDLWAGGTGGALFHSADAGRSWSRVKVGDEGMWVTDAITAVDFPSPRNGFVTTASGAIWATQDAGRTWQRRQ